MTTKEEATVVSQYLTFQLLLPLAQEPVGCDSNRLNLGGQNTFFVQCNGLLIVSLEPQSIFHSADFHPVQVLFLFSFIINLTKGFEGIALREERMGHG